ncbi:hypothetical protein [Synechococcus sp. LTW-G]
MGNDSMDINADWAAHMQSLARVQKAASEADSAMIQALRGLREYHSRKISSNSPADIDYGVITELLSALHTVIEHC